MSSWILRIVWTAHEGHGFCCYVQGCREYLSKNNLNENHFCWTLIFVYYLLIWNNLYEILVLMFQITKTSVPTRATRVFSYPCHPSGMNTHWNPCPISDQHIWFPLPYFRPKLLFSIHTELKTLFPESTLRLALFHFKMVKIYTSFQIWGKSCIKTTGIVVQK